MPIVSSPLSGPASTPRRSARQKLEKTTSPDAGASFDRLLSSFASSLRAMKQGEAIL
jgi:hypothetical protein